VALGVAVGPKSHFMGDWSFGGAGHTGQASHVSRVLVTVAAALFVPIVALSGTLPARAATIAAASSQQSADSGTGQSGVAVLDVAVLVDESGSETAQSVADEKQTVGQIVQTMLNPASRVTVIGFGGVNNVVPNQNPVDTVCQPTIASGPSNLDYLANCVGKIHKRSEAEGNDTDYAAALTQAMSYLGNGSTATPPSPAKAIKVILMMTDGAVDVHRNTQQYTNDWKTGEQTAIDQQLADAKAAGVQVWPLGFGADVGTGVTQADARTYLNHMAAGGAPAVCGSTKQAPNQPHATWVNSSPDAINALNELYADAACLGTSTDRETVSHGLSVNIPAIASSAAISVDRVNPAIQVSFTKPDGTIWSDTSAISGADSTSPVEVLHVANVTKDDVGPWHIKLTAPPSLASQLVSATIFWQGAVRAIITATPSVKPGQPIDVKLTILGPDGPITDPQTLNGLLVGVTAKGQGLPSPERVPVSANGVGTYSGTYTAPSQPTSLTITGTASGYGLYATNIPATVAVGTSTAFVATPHFSGDTSVRVGQSIGGTVDFTNQSGQARHVRLVLAASGTKATITPSTPITVPSTTSGNPPSVPFTVTIDPSAAAASAQLAVQAVDADTGQPYSTATAEVQVTTPPTFFDKYRWIIFGLIGLLLLLLLAGVVAYLINRDRKDVRGLVAELRRGGMQMGRALEPGEQWAEVFPFDVRDAASDAPFLDHPARGAVTPLYQVRRVGRGKVRLTTPTGLRPYDIEVNGSGLRMDHGLELSFRDTRHLNWVGTGGPVDAAEWNGSGTLGASAQGSPDPAQTVHDWGGSGFGGGASEWNGSGGTGDWNGGAGGPGGTGNGTGSEDTPTVTMPTPPQRPQPQPNDPWM
jgi:hypothetical protein